MIREVSVLKVPELRLPAKTCAEGAIDSEAAVLRFSGGRLGLPRALHQLCGTFRTDGVLPEVAWFAFYRSEEQLNTVAFQQKCLQIEMRDVRV